MPPLPTDGTEIVSSFLNGREDLTPEGVSYSWIRTFSG